MRSLGVPAGVSDLIAVHEGKPFALKLKADGGRPTEAQLQFINDFRAAGGDAMVAEGLDQAPRVLETWNLLRGTAAHEQETQQNRPWWPGSPSYSPTSLDDE